MVKEYEVNKVLLNVKVVGPNTKGLFQNTTDHMVFWVIN